MVRRFRYQSIKASDSFSGQFSPESIPIGSLEANAKFKNKLSIVPRSLPIQVPNLPTTQPQPTVQQLLAASQKTPVRIKTKGLLERRGSSASLTLDLSGDSVSFSSPTKECSAVDYLSSAGSRMTRKQLRASLNSPEILHQEFLDIPLNHPNRLDIPGASNKNRYRTIWPNEKTRVLLHRGVNPAHQPRGGSQSRPISGHTTPIHSRPSTPSQSHQGGPARSQSRPNTPSGGGAPSWALGTSHDPADMYINANYVRGYDDEPMAFIATQGPLASTVQDFWLCVWQEKCPAIVCMTRLRENNKPKCEAYLPDKSRKHGDIVVTVGPPAPRNGYSIRDCVLKHAITNEVRSVRHYWLTSWPDQAAPKAKAIQLLQLAAEVQSHRSEQRLSHGLAETGPTLVHCSAGIGRTGCFIAICIGAKQLREEHMVDVLGVVCQMRMDRGGMVQTPEQYVFIHQVLAVYESQLPESPASARICNLQQSSANGNANSCANANGKREKLQMQSMSFDFNTPSGGDAVKKSAGL